MCTIFGPSSKLTIKLYNLTKLFVSSNCGFYCILLLQLFPSSNPCLRHGISQVSTSLSSIVQKDLGEIILVVLDQDHALIWTSFGLLIHTPIPCPILIGWATWIQAQTQSPCPRYHSNIFIFLSYHKILFYHIPVIIWTIII